MTETRADLDNCVWLRREALADGLSDRQIQRLVRSGAWHRVRRGAYCSGELWARLGAADRHRVLCRAVLRTAHPATVLSHISAAIEHGFAVWGPRLDEVHVTRTDGKSGRREAGVCHHRGVLTEAEVVTLRDVRATSAARAVVESCTILDVEQGLVITNSALNSRRVGADDIRRISKDTMRWPESLTTRLVTDLMHPDIESVGESRAWHLFWTEHLPRPEPQLRVRDESGVIVARVDFAWPEYGVFLEFDGREKYARFRREDESLDEFLMREKRREELVSQLTGWTCVRISWQDLDRPALLARRLRRILASRAPVAG